MRTLRINSHAVSAASKARAPPGCPAGLEGLVGRLFPPLTADDAAGEADAFGDHQVESLTIPVRPDGADFDPLRFAVAALFRVDDDIGGMGWLGAHGAFLSLPRPPQPGLDAARPWR